jgi:hypothetical protein
MLRPLAACILRTSPKGAVPRLLKQPVFQLNRGFESKHAFLRAMCAGRKGSVDPLGRGKQWPVLDIKEELQEDDGPLGRIMTEERMREQVANSLDIQVLHRLQIMTSESKDMPQPSNSLEYTSQSKIHSSLALNYLSSVNDQSTPKSDTVGSTESVPVVEASSADTDFPIATNVPASIVRFNKQRLHMQVAKKESFEFASACSILVEVMRHRIEAARRDGGLSTDDVEADGIFASSVVKKRRKKMNKHKIKKRRKRDRGYTA